MKRRDQDCAGRGRKGASRNLVRVGAALVVGALLANAAAAEARPHQKVFTFGMSPAVMKASRQERRREMRLLGITILRKGKNAIYPNRPNFANYDEAKANPYPHLPPLMTLRNGTQVKTLAQWRERRAQIRALFAEYVYGKKPKDVPKVTWKVASVHDEKVYGVSAIVEHLIGRVDNSRDPAITVDIPVTLATPAAARGKPVPVIIGDIFIHPFFPGMNGHHGPYLHFPGTSMCIAVGPPTEPAAQQLLERGWGFASVDYDAVQPDNGAGLVKGIIGLTHRGKPRKMDTWGVLRAWAWAINRTVDYLETDPEVNPHEIGVMGHSRDGKAALLALAVDPRIAVGYISSSGKGGADLYRRNYGENLGSLASPTEFQWFAGNFLRYASPGYTANDMPVDSQELLALVAPRAIFIGAGSLIMHPACAIPGDAWQDARGMFMAEAAASPAWKMYGEKGLGTHTPYPPLDTMVGSRYAAFRRQPYGHTPAPNWPYFIQFAARVFATRK